MYIGYIIALMYVRLHLHVHDNKIARQHNTTEGASICTSGKTLGRSLDFLQTFVHNSPDSVHWEHCTAMIALEGSREIWRVGIRGREWSKLRLMIIEREAGVKLTILLSSGGRSNPFSGSPQPPKKLSASHFFSLCLSVHLHPCNIFCCLKVLC